MILVMIIIGITCRVSNASPGEQMMIQRTYPEPTYPSYDAPTTGSVYVIPVYCPHCMNKLELERVEWVGSGDITCPSCMSVVQVGVRENF